MKTHALLGCMIASLSSMAFAEIPDSTLLPDELKIYVNEKVGLSRSAFPGAKQTVLPINNEYKDKPGCYVACYSKNPKSSTYKLYENAYVMGQVRVKGHYQDAMCLPTGFDGKDLSATKEMKDLCEKAFPAMCEKGSCWADGKTSTWIEYN